MANVTYAQHTSAKNLAIAFTSKIDSIKEAEEPLSKYQSKNADVNVRMWEKLVEHWFRQRAAAPDADTSQMEAMKVGHLGVEDS